MSGSALAAAKRRRGGVEQVKPALRSGITSQMQRAGGVQAFNRPPTRQVQPPPHFQQQPNFPQQAQQAQRMNPNQQVRPGQRNMPPQQLNRKNQMPSPNVKMHINNFKEDEEEIDNRIQSFIQLPESSKFFMIPPLSDKPISHLQLLAVVHKYFNKMAYHLPNAIDSLGTNFNLLSANCDNLNERLEELEKLESNSASKSNDENNTENENNSENDNNSQNDSELEESNSAISIQMQELESLVNTSIDSLKHETRWIKIDLDDKINLVSDTSNKNVASIKSELKREIEDMRSGFKREINNMKMDFSNQIQSIRSELLGKLNDVERAFASNNGNNGNNVIENLDADTQSVADTQSIADTQSVADTTTLDLEAVPMSAQVQETINREDIEAALNININSIEESSSEVATATTTPTATKTKTRAPPKNPRKNTKK